MRPRLTERRIALSVGILGGLGGVVISALYLRGSSYGGGDPAFADFSEAQLTAYSSALLALFCVAFAAAIFGLRSPRASGLTLIVAGGLSLVLAVFGMIITILGGLLLIPFGFLVFLAGVILIAHGDAGTAST